MNTELMNKLSNNEVVTTAVNSSNLATWSYNPLNKELTVLFNRGSVYRYSGVDKDTVVRLLNAESVGKEFRKSIMGKFEYYKDVEDKILQVL